MPSRQTHAQLEHSNARKKYPRSTSPRAVDRRRLQNRIAQRNHRRKLKDARSSGTSERSDSSERAECDLPSDTVTPVGLHCTPPALLSELQHPELPIVNEGSMSDDHADGVQKPLPLFDPMLMGGASISNPFMYSLCGCNGSTGPCFRHMEELRLQLLQTHQVLHRGAPSAGNDSSTTPPLPQHDGLDRMELTSSHGSLPRHHQGLDSLQASQASRMPSASLESPSCHSQQPSSVPSTSTLPSNSGARSSNDVDDIASRDTPHSSARSASPNETAANNTWRFTRILETVQELGFADFDSMVEAYYTGDFVKSSWPGDAQRGSRTRGFPKLASRIQESSERWPRWQHRMISQGIMSCAKTICAGELEALVRNIEVQQAHNDGIRLPLSSEMYSSRRSSPRPSPGAGDCREILTSSLSTLGTLPESIESAIHDEALHTLSLLTELATPSSPYCDRVASIAIAFLVDSRKGL